MSTTAHKITFVDPEGTETVAPADPSKTLLEIAEEHGVKLGSACGGVCACSSCHVYVRAGDASLPEMEDAEEDRLDMGFDVQPASRLGCQVKPGDCDLKVEISRESIETWYNEHPERRAEQK
ncbi:MAG: 2Fe-2S iron-sulfur cluster binding domain-containing protein [Nannocystaceae bacterium]|nr:2Fe-2S iron-sulfur cluster binding domain-containing protein [Nannocystaceae bacterium]